MIMWVKSVLWICELQSLCKHFIIALRPLFLTMLDKAVVLIYLHRNMKCKDAV